MVLLTEEPVGRILGKMAVWEENELSSRVFQANSNKPHLISKGGFDCQ